MIWVPKQSCHKTPLIWYKSYGKKLLRRGWLDRLSPHYFWQYSWKFYCLEIYGQNEKVVKKIILVFPSALQSYNWKHTEAGHLGSPSNVHKLNIDDSKAGRIRGLIQERWIIFTNRRKYCALHVCTRGCEQVQKAPYTPCALILQVRKHDGGRAALQMELETQVLGLTLPLINTRAGVTPESLWEVIKGNGSHSVNPGCRLPLPSSGSNLSSWLVWKYKRVMKRQDFLKDPS